MARPKARSRPYTLRFPANLEEPIAEEAARNNQTPRQWLETILEQLLNRKFTR